MARIQSFELDGVIDVTTRINEVLIMKDSLDNMKKGLRSFKKYVPSDLVADLISLQQEALLGTGKRELTVFFCDLENFTTASEQLSPEDLNILLTGYFDAVTRSLQKYGATIDKFIGDAVMAFWNAPRDTPDHAYQGALASLEVRRSLALLMEGWKSVGLPGLATRVGLNTGTVMVGNVGYEHRLSYTALGDAVNVASRLESLNKFYGTHLLAGEATLAALRGRVKHRVVDRVAVKGKSKGSQIAELADVRPASWDAYDRGFAAYTSGDFAGALREFTDPGLANWDGTWYMNDK